MKYIELPELQRLSKALTHYGPECAVHTRIEAYSCKNINRDKRLFRELEHAYADEHANAIHNAHPSVSLPTGNGVSAPKNTSHASNPRNHGTQSQSYNSNHSSSTVNLAVAAPDDMMPFGPMDNLSARKTLYLLIATLNIAFPHHEFSDVKPAHFCREPSGASVLNALSTTLVAPHRPGMQAPRTYSSYPPPSLPASSSPSFLRSTMEHSHSPGSGSVSGSFSNLSLNSSSPLSYNIPRSPYAPPAIVSGTHPTLYRLLDSIIGLSDCAVYSYTPDIDSDPHAIDDDEDADEEFDEAESEEEDADEVLGGWGGVGSFGSRSGFHVRSANGSNARARSGKGGWIPADDDMMFEIYDDYDVDEISRSERRSSRQEHLYGRGFNSGYPYADSDSDSPHSRTRPTTNTNAPNTKSSSNRQDDTGYYSSSHARIRIARKKHGALLWSSHWFFHNKKMKRILFVSVWARTHGGQIWTTDEEDGIGFEFGYPRGGVDDVDESSPDSSRRKRRMGKSEERFVGWEGAEGAGARAMGIKYVSPSTLG